MKSLLLFCFMCVAIVACTEEVRANSENEEVFREEYCNTLNNSKKEECSSYRCNKDNTKVIGVACAEARCSGKTVGYKGDPTKPYPDCCMIPICDDSSEV